MSEKPEEIFRGKTEEEILEFLALEGELIVELDKLPTRMKRAILENLRQIANLPDWMQSIILEDIDATVVNRIGTMTMIIQGQKQNEPITTFRSSRDVTREQREKE